MDAALSPDKWYTFIVGLEDQKMSFAIYDIEADNLIEIFNEVEIDQNTWDSGYVGFCRDNAAEVMFDDIALVEPLQLPKVMFDLGSDFANRKLSLYPEMMEVTTDANGKATFTDAYAGVHALSVYNEDETEEEYISAMFLAKSDTFEAGGNGINMTSAGATITMQLVSGELVITDAVSGIVKTLPPNVLLSENFDSDPIDSAFDDMIAAGCSISGGKLTNAGVTQDIGGKERVYTTSDIDFSDYMFEADVTANYGSGWRYSTFLFRTSTYINANEKLEGNYYTLQIGRYADMSDRTTNLQVWVYKRSEGANSYIFGAGESSSIGLELPAGTGITETSSVNYSLKVLIEGTSFKAYANNVLIADVTLDGGYSSGGFGFTSTNNNLVLDNVVVTNLATTSSGSSSSMASSSSSSSSTSSSSADILLDENFDNSSINSAFDDMITAGCAVSGGKLTNASVPQDGSGNKNRVYTTSDIDFSDYMFEADATANYGASYRLSTFYFRTSTYTNTSGALEGNFYALQIGRYANMSSRTSNLQVWITKRTSGTNSFLLGSSSTDGIQLPNGTGITESETNYHLKVIINGTSFKAYTNNVLIADITLDGTYSSGGFGFASTNNSLVLDNIVVTNLATTSSAASSSAASSSAASSSVASSSAAASSATSSIGATGLADITMGSTKDSLFSEDFDSMPIDSAFDEMVSGGWAVLDGKFNNSAQTPDQYGNRSGKFTDSSIDYDDFTIEMDVSVSQDFAATWRSASFYFRSIPVETASQKKVNTGYYFAVGRRSGKLSAQFAKRINGVSEYLNGDATEGVDIPQEAGITATTKSYRVKIVVEGSTFKGYINDVFVCEATDSAYTSGGFGVASTNQIVTLDNINVYNPLTLSAASFDLGSDFANRKVELHSDVMTGTTNAQGLVTFTNIAAGDHQLIVYDAAGTNVAYTVNLFLAEGTALEAGGNGVNMTSAGATITLQLVGGQLVITSATAGTGTITSQGTSATGDTTNVWMLIAIMALAAGAVFTVKKIKV